MQELISVIVPIYHVEDYLEECIESILNQTYSNLEIILVDDGGDDNCPRICDEYVKCDERIFVIHKENGGLSDARNAGLDVANGEYICFIDSDDAIHPKFIETLYQDLVSNDVDLAIGNYESVFEVPKDNVLEASSNVHIFTKEEILNELYGEHSLLIIIAWNKLYKKHIWKNLRYPKGKIHEDEFVVHYILDQVNRVSMNDVKYYYYRQREGSITNNYSEKRLQALEAIEDRISFYEKIENQNLLTQTIYQYFFVIYNHLGKIGCLENKEQIRRQLKSKLQSTYKLLMKKNNLSFFRKIKVKIYLHRSRLF